MNRDMFVGAILGGMAVWIYLSRQEPVTELMYVPYYSGTWGGWSRPWGGGFHHGGHRGIR